jgi:hypothetical protein
MPATQTVPLRLILHLASPPADKLLLAPNAEACKQAFMGQLKEADFMRWGNTKRMTGLRKAEQDGIWEGIRERECSCLLAIGAMFLKQACRQLRRLLAGCSQGDADLCTRRTPTVSADCALLVCVCTHPTTLNRPEQYPPGPGRGVRCA